MSPVRSSRSTRSRSLFNAIYNGGERPADASWLYRLFGSGFPF
jgi:hypothetical protein